MAYCRYKESAGKNKQNGTPYNGKSPQQARPLTRPTRMLRGRAIRRAGHNHMRDYTIMHACGLEQYETNKAQAIREAKKHKRQCLLDPLPPVFIDESNNKELTGKYWKF